MRWKLVAGNVVAVLLVGLLAWVMVRNQVADALTKDVDPSVDRAVALIDAVRTQDGDLLLNTVTQAASSPDAAQIFASGTESEQREAAFTFADGFARRLGVTLVRRGRPPELAAVTAADGSVLARNLERHQDAGRQFAREYPAVAYAIQAPGGHSVRDFIRYGEQGWLEAAVAPIVVNGQLKGAIVVGYTLADSAARSDAQRLGVDVGFLFREDNRYTVQSLSVGQQPEKQQLRDWANTPATNFQGLLGHRQHVTLALGDEQFRATAVPMPGAYTPQQAGVVVLRSVTAARAPTDEVTRPILLFMLLGVLLVVVYGIMVANYLERPIEQIEDGLLQVINGNQDYRIELEHAELGGIVYRINQLVAELTGEEEEADEQGRISHPPPRSVPEAAPATAAQPIIDESAMGEAPDPALAQSLAAEDENSYYERLFRAYGEARKAAQLPPDPQPYEQFVDMVRRVEQSLAQRYACTLVRFRVQMRGGQVIFRPVPIR